ncbi:MAG: hypothetical protein EPO24_06330 [Bacteroidetes bacterium]|nr:MAG: hypothetical protein EPO24_06330 [Bacteroidota bacterium]
MALVLLPYSVWGCSEQHADPNVDMHIQAPVYTTTHPGVLFDEAHNNNHNSGGTDNKQFALNIMHRLSRLI